MFRSMRRFKQQISEEECIHILKEQKRGVLSVIGDGGYPYGIPLNHRYEPVSTGSSQEWKWRGLQLLCKADEPV